SWPAGLETQFLADYARGVAELPRIVYPKYDFSEVRRELDAITRAADPDHPLGQYLAESAQSWSVAAELLESLGTAAVTDCSMRLYGKPDEALPGHGPSTREAARHFISIADELDHELMAPAE
ncbi:tyrosine/phenylalanine carboxypeptidase domain-containing protein, partial [Lysobacter sp. A3-1-A15]